MSMVERHTSSTSPLAAGIDTLVATWALPLRVLRKALAATPHAAPVLTALDASGLDEDTELLLRWRAEDAGRADLALTLETESRPLLELRRVTIAPGQRVELSGGRIIALDAAPHLTAHWARTADGMKLLYAATDATASLGIPGGRYNIT